MSLNLSISVGDEGGFAPDLSSNFIALDVAASEFFVMKDATYNLQSEKRV